MLQYYYWILIKNSHIIFNVQTSRTNAILWIITKYLVPIFEVGFVFRFLQFFFLSFQKEMSFFLLNLLKTTAYFCADMVNFYFVRLITKQCHCLRGWCLLSKQWTALPASSQIQSHDTIPHGFWTRIYLIPIRKKWTAVQSISTIDLSFAIENLGINCLISGSGV